MSRVAELEPGFVCRRALPADAGPLAALAREIFGSTFGSLYRPEDLAQFFEDSYREDLQAAEIGDPERDTFVAEAAGRLVAYAQIGPLSLPASPPANERPIELKRLYVARDWQGRGPGETLMRMAMDAARARGGDAVYLSVYAENFRAQRFYARHGFSKIADFRFKVGDHYDPEWLMRAPC